MAKQGFFSQHWLTDGKPAGGVSTGKGFTISWQNGPLRQSGREEEPNGAFVEDLIAAICDRIEFYQAGGFACAENAAALEALEEAVRCLDARTARRVAAGTGGTHAPD